MSFILDALKKAESERNRRVAPVLMDARIAPPRRGLPGWALVLGVVLLVNLAVVAWLLLRTPPHTPARTTEALEPVAPPPAYAPVVQASQPPAILPEQPVPQPAALPPPPVQESGTADSDALPTLEELRYAGITLPDLQLDLHIYDPAPGRRSVLLNSQRLREGDYTSNGVKLERITPAGVVLEAGGRRFRLDAGG